MTIKEVNEGFFQPIHPERAVTLFQIGSHIKRSSWLLSKTWKKVSWQNVLRNFTILLDRKMKDTTKQLVSEALELVLTNISKHKAEKNHLVSWQTQMSWLGVVLRDI